MNQIKLCIYPRDWTVNAFRFCFFSFTLSNHRHSCQALMGHWPPVSLSLSEGITQFLLPTCSPYPYSSLPFAFYNGLFVASLTHICASLHVIIQNGHTTLRLTLHEQNQQQPTTEKVNVCFFLFHM